MSDLPPERTQIDTPNPSPAASAARQAQVRAEALSLLIGGALCLWFGFTLALSAPANVPDDVAEKWFMADRVCYYILRGVGCGLLLAAALAAAGIRASLLIAVVSELVLALLMVAMAVIWTWRAQVSGGFDPMVILLGLFAIVAIVNVRRALRLNQAIATGRPDPTE